MSTCVNSLNGCVRGTLVLLMGGVCFITLVAVSSTPALIEAGRPNPPRVLEYEQTLALVSFNGADATLDTCRLFLAESNDKFTKVELLSRLGRKYSRETVDLKTMLAVVDQCGTLQKAYSEDVMDYEDEGETEYYKLFKGILPGTLWCGYDDLAPDFFSLGTARKLDSCCRSHDHCPVKVKAFQNRYGVLNLHPYTKVLCGCDKSFYDCLKSVKSKKADAVGHFFFNFVKVQCLQEVPSSNCTSLRRKKSLFPRSQTECSKSLHLQPVPNPREY